MISKNGKSLLRTIYAFSHPLIMCSNNQSNNFTGISATVYSLFNAYFMVSLDIPVEEQAYEKIIKKIFSEKIPLEFSEEEFSRWNDLLNEVFSKFKSERKEFRKEFIQCTIQAILCKYFSPIAYLFNEISTHHPENWFMYAPYDEVEVSKKDCIKNHVSSEKHQCIVDFILKFLQRYGSFSPLSNESNETDSNPPKKKKKRVDPKKKDLDNISPKQLDFDNDVMINDGRHSADLEDFKKLI